MCLAFMFLLLALLMEHSKYVNSTSVTEYSDHQEFHVFQLSFKVNAAAAAIARHLMLLFC